VKQFFIAIDKRIL